MRGIIHSIIVLVDDCLGSVLGIIVILDWTQVLAPTSAGIIIGEGSGLAKSSHKKPLSRGTVELAKGFQEYNLWERPTRSSGFVPSVLIMAW